MKKFISIFLFLFLTTQDALALTLKNISYSDTGQGQPLVLIHAFPANQQLWQQQVAALQSSFRVITLDLSGFGASQASDGAAITMTDYADEVKQLLDQLHISKAIVGGESMGGYVALAFLQKYPEAVTGLILADTQAVADSAEAKIKREASAVDVLTHGVAPFVQNFMPKALSPSASPKVRDDLLALLNTASAQGVASALRGMALRSDTMNVLDQTMVPVLIIVGENDAVIPPTQSQTMHAHAKNSKLVVIANAGHLANLEQPEQWNQAVLDMFHAQLRT